jgi:hypothetical protein
MIIEKKAYRGCLMRRTKKSTRKTTGMVRGRVGNALANASCAFETDKEAPAVVYRWHRTTRLPTRAILYAVGRCEIRFSDCSYEICNSRFLLVATFQ